MPVRLNLCPLSSKPPIWGDRQRTVVKDRRASAFLDWLPSKRRIIVFEIHLKWHISFSRDICIFIPTIIPRRSIAILRSIFVSHNNNTARRWEKLKRNTNTREISCDLSRLDRSSSPLRAARSFIDRWDEFSSWRSIWRKILPINSRAASLQKRESGYFSISLLTDGNVNWICQME